MILENSWSYRPYTESSKQERALLPYVCRISFEKKRFTVDFIDNGSPDSEHILMWRVRESGEFVSCDVAGNTAVVSGLEENTEYEFYVQRAEDAAARSETRLVRTGSAPGKVINYLHPEDDAYEFAGKFLDSPSLVKLPSGRLVASMGVHCSPTYGENLTLLYCSDDDGESWHYLCELFPLAWGKLFVDGGKLYCLGASRTYGDLLIGCSEDEGENWGMPTVLIRGSSVNCRGGIHRSPMPILSYKGRLICDIQYGTWHQNYFVNGVLSAKSGSNLLDVNNWAVTKWWDRRDHSEIMDVMDGGMTGDSDAFKFACGGIEGSPVVAPNGDVWVIHRFGIRKPLVFDYDLNDPFGELKNARLTDIPIMDSKASVERDEVSGAYYMMCNYAPDGENVGRTVCALMKSEDLLNWEIDQIVLDYKTVDRRFFAIQYFDFVFDNDDIIFLSRTACNSPKNFHDSNCQTFHRIKNFRKKQNI